MKKTIFILTLLVSSFMLALVTSSNNQVQHSVSLNGVLNKAMASGESSVDYKWKECKEKNGKITAYCGGNGSIKCKCETV